MDRAFASGSSGTPPGAPASPSIGYPTAGNPSGGTPATKPGPYWYHMITEELRAIVAAAGLTPAQGTLDQVLQALPAALASRPEMAKSLASAGYQKLPGGLIIQWGSYSNVSTPLGVSTFYVAPNQSFPIAFPNACLKIVGSSSLNFCIAQAVIVSASQYTPRFSQSGGSGAINVDLYWVAIGY